MSAFSHFKTWLKGIFFLVVFIGSMLCLAEEIPTAYRFERYGRGGEGKLLRYDPAFGTRYKPVVEIRTPEGSRTAYGRESWRHRWYSEGERVTVLELPGLQPSIGGPIMRWSFALLLLWLFAGSGFLVFLDLRALIRAVRAIKV